MFENPKKLVFEFYLSLNFLKHSHIIPVAKTLSVIKIMKMENRMGATRDSGRRKGEFSV